MKKFLAILAAVGLCVSLTACGDKGGSGSGTQGGTEQGGEEPLGEHKHVYTDKSSCDLCGEEWHATESDGITFTPVVLGGVEGYDVSFGEFVTLIIPSDPLGRPDYTQDPIRDVYGKPFEEEELVLPCVHEGKPVISVGRAWSCYSETVKKITLPDSIISFGAPELSSIRHGAFSGCKSLEELVLPYEPYLGGVTYYSGYSDAVPIYYGSLFGMGEGVESPLSQNYRDGALYIGEYLINVNSCEGKVFTVKEGTKGIASNACRTVSESEVEEVRIPASVTEIGENAFTYSRPPLPSGENIPSLKKVTFAENSSLKRIDSGAFYNCNQLAEIDFPDGLEWIGEDAFGFCTSLSEFRIPDSVRRVGQNAFRFTPFERAFMTRSDPYGSSAAEYNMQENEIYSGTCLIKVNPDLEGAYTVREGTTAIAGGAFRDCKKITSVTLPEDLTAIDAGMFCDCHSLESVVLPKGIKVIGDSAFGYCISLTSVTISEGVTTIDPYAFYECSALQSVTIPEGVTMIGNNAFAMCDSLKKVMLPHSLKEISQRFYYGKALQEIEYHGTVEEWLDLAVLEMSGDAWTTPVKDADMEYVIGTFNAGFKVVCTDGTVAIDGTVTKN